MSITEYINLGLEFITFDRMLIIVGAGLVTVYLDGRLMHQKGLHREGLWAKAIGWTLVIAGISAWIVSKIFG